jgi:hypothetical protein
VAGIEEEIAVQEKKEFQKQTSELTLVETIIDVIELNLRSL